MPMAVQCGCAIASCAATSVAYAAMCAAIVMLWMHARLRLSGAQRPVPETRARRGCDDLIFGFLIDKDRLDAVGKAL